MSVAQKGELGGWQSRTTFVLMLSASAIGLGSLWRFSYLVGENGGGLFMVSRDGKESRVLSPTVRESRNSGDRTYRCLAGRGTDQLTTPTLARR